MSKSRQTGANHTDLNTNPAEIAKLKTMMMCYNTPRHPMENSKEEIYEDTREAGSLEDKTSITELLKDKHCMKLSTDEQYNLGNISYAFLCITRMKEVPKQASKCLRTIALVINEIDIRKASTDTLSGKISEEISAALKPHIKKINYKLKVAIIEIMKKQHKEFKTILTTAPGPKPPTMETQQPNETTNDSPKNYVQVTKTNISTVYGANINNRAIKAQQIVTDKDTDTGHYLMAFL